jgi:hypothetical protein
MIWYLEDFYSSLLGHLQTLLYFPIVLDFRTFFSVHFVYSVNPCPIKTSRGSILLLWSFYTLFTLCPFETKKWGVYVSFRPEKGEYMLVLDWKCIFNSVK